jgi:hypothetical protein
MNKRLLTVVFLILVLGCKAKEVLVASPASTSNPAPSSTVSVEPGATTTAPLNAANDNGVQMAMSVFRVGPDGALAQVPPDFAFRHGDRVKIGVTSNRDGFLYLILRGSSGKTIALYPEAGRGGGNTVKAGMQKLFPPNDTFSFDRTPGTETILAVYSEKPEPSMDRVTGGGGGSSERDQVAKDLSAAVEAAPATISATRDMIFKPSAAATELGLPTRDMSVSHQAKPQAAGSVSGGTPVPTRDMSMSGGSQPHSGSVASHAPRPSGGGSHAQPASSRPAGATPVMILSESSIVGRIDLKHEE